VLQPHQLAASVADRPVGVTTAAAAAAAPAAAAVAVATAAAVAAAAEDVARLGSALCTKHAAAAIAVDRQCHCCCPLPGPVGGQLLPGGLLLWECAHS
jgi:hypothetical protein